MNPNVLDAKYIELYGAGKAAGIGFLAGIFLFGVVAWSLSPKKQLGFLIPMLIPISIIYRLIKNPKQNTNLEAVLKERHLD